MARDRLYGYLGSGVVDVAVLDTLGFVLHSMNDLPAAGACWLLTDRADDGPLAGPAFRAFEARYRSPMARATALPITTVIERYPAAARRRVEDLIDQINRPGSTQWWNPPYRVTFVDEVRRREVP